MLLKDLLKYVCATMYIIIVQDNKSIIQRAYAFEFDIELLHCEVIHIDASCSKLIVEVSSKKKD